jgi:hypothetical protein
MMRISASESVAKKVTSKSKNEKFSTGSEILGCLRGLRGSSIPRRLCCWRAKTMLRLALDELVHIHIRRKACSDDRLAEEFANGSFWSRCSLTRYRRTGLRPTIIQCAIVSTENVSYYE